MTLCSFVSILNRWRWIPCANCCNCILHWKTERENVKWQRYPKLRGMQYLDFCCVFASECQTNIHAQLSMRPIDWRVKHRVSWGFDSMLLHFFCRLHKSFLDAIKMHLCTICSETTRHLSLQIQPVFLFENNLRYCAIAEIGSWNEQISDIVTLYTQSAKKKYASYLYLCNHYSSSIDAMWIYSKNNENCVSAIGSSTIIMLENDYCFECRQ